jgi:tetratricopeptide (TPR) repeat protein
MADRDHPVMAFAFLGLMGTAVFGLATWRTMSPAPQKGGGGGDLEAQIIEAVGLGEAGQVEEAAIRLAKITDEHPDNVDALFNYGVALTGLEQYDEADRVFRRVLELDPKDYDVVAERASLKIDQDKVDEAIQIAGTIPRGEGRMPLRLDHDPRWAGLRDDPRVMELRKKHGLIAGDVAQPSPAAAAP